MCQTQDPHTQTVGLVLRDHDPPPLEDRQRAKDGRGVQFHLSAQVHEPHGRVAALQGLQDVEGAFDTAHCRLS